jgi:hypothetical protein
MLILTYGGRLRTCKGGYSEAFARVARLIGRDLNVWEKLRFRRSRFLTTNGFIFALSWV